MPICKVTSRRISIRSDRPRTVSTTPSHARLTAVRRLMSRFDIDPHDKDCYLPTVDVVGAVEAGTPHATFP